MIASGYDGKTCLMNKPCGEEIICCEFCCEGNAEVFQATGNYCLSCWQEETLPDV